jgi:hypothetical protein
MQDEFSAFRAVLGWFGNLPLFWQLFIIGFIVFLVGGYYYGRNDGSG